LEAIVDTADFIETLAISLREHGFDWVVESVLETIAQGADTERKDASAVGLSKRAKESGDVSSTIANSVDYLSLFEIKPGRATATVTRPYTDDEIVNLYLTAIYSIFVEPAELSYAGLELFGPEVSSVAFVSEDGSEELDLLTAYQKPYDSDIVSNFANILKGVIFHAA